MYLYITPTAEFIIALAVKHASLEKFKKVLAKKGAEFPVNLVYM